MTPRSPASTRILEVERHASPELLDTDSGTRTEIAASLSDLRFFNRWFGGVATTRSLIQAVARRTGESEFSMLEVAAGDGSLAQDLCTSLSHRGIRLHITLLDRALSHLLGRESRNGTRMPSVVADALRLPFPDSAFDLVSCSLFAHHLSPEQVTLFARESLRVCRLAVLVNDLIRHPMHLALIYAGMPLYRSRLTRHDAPASVRQAYTAEEMSALFQQAQAASVEVRRHYLYRMGIIAWKGGQVG